jgi:ParB-like chromosome segregation protein Spo0J|tara:strand:- start:23350 stop:23868 length:519 start_codon:yes stop_codon:yes gene_type:complete
MKKGLEFQPINNVQWVDRNKLKANNYNPNKVAPIELKLLVNSILTSGWTQPIVIRSDYEIVDGYHRWLVADKKEIKEKLDGKVPVVFISDEMSQAEQISATITHNRARGTHYIMRMASIVRELKDVQKKDDLWIQNKLGMEQEEINRLYDNSTSKETKSKEEFNNGWVPKFE